LDYIPPEMVVFGTQGELLMRKKVYGYFTLKALSLLVLAFLLFTYKLDAQASIDYPLKPWDQWMLLGDFSGFGAYRSDSNESYHSRIDLSLKTPSSKVKERSKLMPPSKPVGKIPATDVESVPTIIKVDPAMASISGGTELTITGTGFKATPPPTVTIGGNPVTGVRVLAKTAIKCIIPAGSVGPADIIVQNAKAKVKSRPFKGFIYYEDVYVATYIPDPSTAPPEGINPPEKISVTFNQNVDPTSVIVKVASANGAEVGGSLSQDTTNSRMFTFTPDESFKVGDYEVTVSGAKGMLAGNIMPSDFTMTFRVTFNTKGPKLKFEAKEFPDGLVGRRYNFALTPTEATPPYSIILISGELPPGLTLDKRTGSIDGEPTKSGEYNFTVGATDSQGKAGTISGDIKVWQRILTVGEHGTFKGIDGFQMALNMVQDMEEIRIERGIFECSGVAIPEGKMMRLIKISGGWDENFEKKGDSNYTTVLDATKNGTILTINNLNGQLYIEDLTFTNSNNRAVRIEIKKEKGEGYFKAPRILPEFINCTFNNNSGGAVNGDGYFINCTFTNNSAASASLFKPYGGAVNGNGTFTNCTFTVNKAYLGGAIYGCGTFKNCVFTDNYSRAEGGGAIYTRTLTSNDSGLFSTYGKRADINCINCIFTENTAPNGRGGAVSGEVSNGRYFLNCLFYNNSASYGGALHSSMYSSLFGSWDQTAEEVINDTTEKIINCTFYGNSAEKDGGAILSDASIIINSIFYKNMVGGKDNDITSTSTGKNMAIDNCVINLLKGTANFGPNNIMGDPRFVEPEQNDFHLRSDSPCINVGNDEFLGTAILGKKLTAQTLDLDGKPRVVGDKVDIGAYEYQGN